MKISHEKFEFTPDDDERKILNFKRSQRIALLEKIVMEINNSALIADPKNGHVYKQYYTELIVSSCFILISLAAKKLNFDLTDFSSILTTLFSKTLKYINSMCDFSLKDMKFIEQHCNNLLKSKSLIYNNISEKFKSEDIQ